MLRVKDRTLTHNGLLLQIVTRIESCFIGIHTTSSVISFYYQGMETLHFDGISRHIHDYGGLKEVLSQ